MKFSEFETDAGPLIEAHEPGQVRIQGQHYQGTLALTAGRILTDWGPAQFEQLTSAHFEVIAALAPQVVVLGTGARQRFPDPALYACLFAQGIGIEIMDTGAACRTYNILAGEGRRVVAALISDA
ncbi:MAG: Mth938-like domain-containing protein [Lamprobacter sp.]|uniref:Mth938-like domain-containing protein n=1 Tax=Lamprobacter sp. TaxID=3100796 RepID=UPI002B261121|nr:Mth938-like domain-containing protein [Lamprobacter sp.]MEA3640760.1 Mth938-like domain-containing protein [Lamprobacter sp.]